MLTSYLVIVGAFFINNSLNPNLSILPYEQSCASFFFHLIIFIEHNYIYIYIPIVPSNIYKAHKNVASLQLEINKGNKTFSLLPPIA